MSEQFMAKFKFTVIKIYFKQTASSSVNKYKLSTTFTGTL